MRDRQRSTHLPTYLLLPHTHTHTRAHKPVVDGARDVCVVDDPLPQTHSIVVLTAHNRGRPQMSIAQMHAARGDA